MRFSICTPKSWPLSYYLMEAKNTWPARDWPGLKAIPPNLLPRSSCCNVTCTLVTWGHFQAAWVICRYQYVFPEWLSEVLICRTRDQPSSPVLPRSSYPTYSYPAISLRISASLPSRGSSSSDLSTLSHLSAKGRVYSCVEIHGWQSSRRTPRFWLTPGIPAVALFIWMNAIST